MAVNATFRYFPSVEPQIRAMPGVVAVIEDDAQAIAEAARGLAPVRTGRYKASISAALERGSEGAVGRVSATAPYAIYIEFGTNDTPTFRPITAAAERFR
jgi:hypothetical protein